MIDLIDGPLDLVGRSVGRGVAVAAAALELPNALLGDDTGRPDPDVGRLGALPTDDSRRIAASGGGDLDTTASGRGPAFLFAHGLTLTSRVWTKQFAELPRAGVRAVAFDQRGHGASTASMAGATLDTLADDLRTVVEGLDLQDALLVGHAIGGTAALAFAARWPELAAARLRGLVVMAAPVRLPVASVPGASRALRPFANGFVRSGVWARSDATRLVARTMFGKYPVRSQVELARVLLASAREDTIVGCAEATASVDVRDRLDRVELPVLVVNGTADLFNSPGDARRLARALPHARLELVPGAGHLVMLERSSRFGALVCGFAREVGVAAGLAA